MLLSQGGHLILIHHVLSCMAIHTLVVLPIPNMVVKKYNLFWLHSYAKRVKEKLKGNQKCGQNCVKQLNKGNWCLRFK